MQALVQEILVSYIVMVLELHGKRLIIIINNNTASWAVWHESESQNDAQKAV